MWWQTSFFTKREPAMLTSGKKVPQRIIEADERADRIWKESSASRPDADGYVSFGDVSRFILGQQCQYGSRYLNGELPGYPNLGKDLRVTGNHANYHSLRIHADDVATFVQRYREYRNGQL